MANPIGIGMIGCGGIAVANHIEGLKLCPGTKMVALCDSNPAVLQRASDSTGISDTFSDFNEMLKHPAVDAVIVATPNVVHAPAALAAIKAGKHVMCEKPLAMNMGECREMLAAANAAGVRHMTAFTYRYVPAMRYMTHLVKEGFLGTPYHFRSCRQQDWGLRNIGWRQVKKLASTGELGDMLSHRIDFAHILMGDFEKVVGDIRRYIDDREGNPSDLEDWSALMGRFTNNATAMMESTKVATGRGEGGASPDYCEVAGSEGTLVYNLGKPNEVQIGKRGESGLRTIPVPGEFLKVPGSPRDVSEGDPVAVFRYDQNFEFINAIREGRDCSPSFEDGLRVQAVMDAVMKSVETEKWENVEY